MRALTVAVLGLGVRSLAFATDANVVVHLYSAPDAGGAVQMCRVNDEIWFPQPNSDSLARINDDGSLTRRNVPNSGSRPLAISRDDGNGRTRVHRGRHEPDRHLRRERRSHGIRHPDVREQPPGRHEPQPRLVHRVRRKPDRAVSGGLAGLHGGVRDPDVRVRALSGSRRGRAVRRCGSPRTWPTRSGASTRAARSRSSTSRRRTAARPRSSGGSTAARSSCTSPKPGETRSRSIAITGQVTEHAIPTPNSSPTDLIFDDFEQAVWFTERNAGKLGWMSIDGDFQEFSLPGSAKPESLVIDYGQFFFGPMSIWYVDGTNRRVGKLSDNHLFALGARHEGTLDTEFELSNSGRRCGQGEARLALQRGRARESAPPTSIELVVPRRGEVEATASEVPNAEGQRFFYVTGIEPEISDVPETRAWVVDEARPEFRLEVPLVSYWTIATLQPPLAAGKQRAPALPDVSRSPPDRFPDEPRPRRDRDRGGRVRSSSRSRRSTPRATSSRRREVEVPAGQRPRARSASFRPRHLRGLRRTAFA